MNQHQSAGENNMPTPQQSCLLTLIALFSLSINTANAAEKPQENITQYKTTVFADDFSADKLSKLWKAYKSESKIKQGVLIGLMPATADHNAVDTVITNSYSDVEVDLDFKFTGSPLFVVAFNEHKFKGSHAGHICRVIVTPKKITLRDGKTGVFQNDIFTKRKTKEGRKDKVLKALLKTKENVIKRKTEKNQWHHLLVRVKKDVLTVYIDGKKIGELTSPGIAHKTKNKLSLVTAKQAMNFDNLKILAP